jgi:serine/threonine-protein kinase
MRDLIGRTLGHYRITAKLGEGGMGEVYRANDERLDRNVAIKVLSEEVAGDPHRLARFEREAILLASLNHPNIATLHGLEEEDGRRFLVMELVEGEDLAGVLVRGAIRVDEALAISLQIAKALEMAHEHSIVHRDLKPANVMVSSEGLVKVLDFGIAKAFDPEASSASSPESVVKSPTLTASMTRAGTLLGTAAYMSPEQARGKAVDKRADIWAFGCVLWEMLTGTRAFAGTTSTDTLAAIIKDDPDWDVLPAETPAPVRRLLRRCLTKDSRDRLHDIADARIVLQSLLIGDFYGDESAASTPIRAGWRTWLLWGLTAVVAALAVAILIGALRTPSPGAVTKMLVGVEPADWLGSVARGRWTSESQRLSRTAMALSPDGRHLVYSAGDDSGSRLFLREMDETQASPITGTEGGVGPFFSPDGEWIGFWADGTLKKVRTDGSPPVSLCDAPYAPYGASWGPSNTIVFGPYEGGILRVTADGGEPAEITVLAEGEFRHCHPQILANGDSLLFTVRRREIGHWDETTIVAQSLKTGERKILVENGADSRYAVTGHLVFTRLGALMAAPFDPKRLEVMGGTVVVLESVRQGVNGDNSSLHTFSGQFNFSTSGTLVHVPGGVWSDRKNSLVWVDRKGRVKPFPVPPGPYVFPRLSPDGTRVAIQKDGFEPADIWVYEISRGALTRLTFEEGRESAPLWTPDGARITFSSDRSGRNSIYWIPADGSGTAKRLSTREGAYPASWSPDGQVLAIAQINDTDQWEIWTLRPEGEAQPFIESPFGDRWPTFSPDGRWLAYASSLSGRIETYVTPYPGPGPRIQISTDGGASPAWTQNGRELFFSGPRNSDGTRSMWAADITTEPSFSAGKPRELFRLDFVSTNPVRNYDVTPDGQMFLMIKKGPQPDEPVTQLHVTLNWFEELKRLAPTE